MERNIANTDQLMRRRPIAVAVATLLIAATGLSAQTRSGPIQDIEQAILRLPYYGPFDAISVSYDKGTVTLGGYAYALGLIRDAERAVKRVSGVDAVVNKIEALPASQNDDELRWRTFYAIYTNSFLSRYAPGAGMLWGHPGGARRAMLMGLQPIGNYPIHIIVQNGRIRLVGEVDTEADKTMANLEARGVPGSFGVDNQVTVRRNP